MSLGDERDAETAVAAALNFTLIPGVYNLTSGNSVADEARLELKIRNGTKRHQD